MLVTFFHENSNKNLFLTPAFALSEPQRTPKHQKIDRQQYYVWKPTPKSKKHTNNRFHMCPVPCDPFDITNR